MSYTTDIWPYSKLRHEVMFTVLGLHGPSGQDCPAGQHGARSPAPQCCVEEILHSTWRSPSCAKLCPAQHSPGPPSWSAAQCEHRVRSCNWDPCWHDSLLLSISPLHGRALMREETGNNTPSQPSNSNHGDSEPGQKNAQRAERRWVKHLT